MVGNQMKQTGYDFSNNKREMVGNQMRQSDEYKEWIFCSYEQKIRVVFQINWKDMVIVFMYQKKHIYSFYSLKRVANAHHPETPEKPGFREITIRFGHTPVSIPGVLSTFCSCLWKHISCIWLDDTATLSSIPLRGCLISTTVHRALHFLLYFFWKWHRFIQYISHLILFLDVWHGHLRREIRCIAYAWNIFCVTLYGHKDSYLMRYKIA